MVAILVVKLLAMTVEIARLKNRQTDIVQSIAFDNKRAIDERVITDSTDDVSKTLE